MQKTRICTNSVSDISPQLAEEYGITLIPDTMIFGEEQLLNNIDIDPPGFYQRLRTASKLPTSAHPNIYQYCKSFASIPTCEEILCVTITSKMSGSVGTASIAARDMHEAGFSAKITIYDSLQVSHGLALMAIEAAKLAKQGYTVAEILPYLDQLQKRVGVYFVMPSLKNAQKGGRVGAIKCFTADAVGIKPILCFTDGLVRDIGFARGMRAGKEAVWQHYIKEANFEKDVFIFHAANLPDAEIMKKRIAEVAPHANVRIAWVGAVIGIYTGEGAIGLAFEKRK